jgi:endo-1,4-beta-xylanase
MVRGRLGGLSSPDAQKLLYGTARRMVTHYEGAQKAWIVANEVTDPAGDGHGLRTTVPWYSTIGPAYVRRCFEIAAEHDPQSLRVLNEFGFETVDQFGDSAEDRRRAFLTALDHLLARPADAGAGGGHPGAPRAPEVRDQKVADVYRHYLDVALDERAVTVVNCFGLSDRYSWLDEDFPRSDGAHRRPLLFDRKLRPKPAYFAISDSFRSAPRRDLLWRLDKGRDC